MSSEDIRNIYIFDQKIIGHGHFGTVRVASLRINPKLRFAVKTIPKEKIKKRLDMLIRELEILKQLDHPNIIKFYETYQDERFFHLVMEYCHGGELLERIIEKGHLDENEARCIMQKAFSAVKHLHKKKVVHRDLKPENFLFATKETDSDIKIIDFGLSKKCYGDNEISLKTVVGTSLYVAPEVLKGTGYNEKCDEWSLGVIMYILLSGSPPFDGNDNNEIFKKITECKYEMDDDEWKDISREAKDLISKLLQIDPNKRITVSMALEHEWFKINISSELVTNQLTGETDAKILRMLRNFSSTSKLRKEALKVIVNYLSDEEIKNLKEIFKKIDKDKSGMITIQELQEAMKSVGYDDSENEITKIMNRINFEDGKNVINYKEFLSVTIDSKIYLEKERLWTVFKYFDVDNTNYITAENLKEAFARAGRKLPDDEFHEMIKEVDILKDGRVSFQEFMHMMKVDEFNVEDKDTDRKLDKKITTLKTIDLTIGK